MTHMPGLLGCPGCLGQRGPQLADLVAVIGDNSLPIDRSPVVSVDVGEAEQHVREIALRSEIILQRRAEQAQADQAMLAILRGVAS